MVQIRLSVQKTTTVPKDLMNPFHAHKDTNNQRQVNLHANFALTHTTVLLTLQLERNLTAMQVLTALEQVWLHQLSANQATIKIH